MTKTITNINVLDVRGRNLQRKLQEVASIKDERNAEQINLSHEIKNKASVTLTIAVWAAYYLSLVHFHV